MPGRGGDWLEAFKGQIPALLQRAQAAGFQLRRRPAAAAEQQGPHPDHDGMGPQADRDGHQGPQGEAPYSEKVPDVDEGFTQADSRTRSGRKPSSRSFRPASPRPSKERPFGYLVREAPAEDVRHLQQLAGHLQAGLFITKFRKIFARDEMNDDLDRAGTLQRRRGRFRIRGIAARVAAVTRGRPRGRVPALQEAYRQHVREAARKAARKRFADRIRN